MIEILKTVLDGMTSNKQNKLRIIHKNEDERLFYAVILEPWTDVTPDGDTHGDRMTAEEIQKSAHYWMLNGGVIFKQHKEKADIKPVETFIAPCDYIPEGSSEIIKKGSWVAGVKVFDDEIWEDVKLGEYESFSPGGYGYRRDIK